MKEMFASWNCIVITCSNKYAAFSAEQEVEYLKKKCRIAESVCVLTIEDPAKNIGSGAATLNALLVATEYLSSQNNYMVISSDVLLDSRILIIHNGRDYLFSSSGKAFLYLPSEYPVLPNGSSASGLLSSLESLLLIVNELAANSPAGVWVCSTDMTLVRTQKSPLDWSIVSDVVLFCIPSDITRASSHGLVLTDEQGLVSDICYQLPSEQIRDWLLDQQVPIVCGSVFLHPHVAEAMLSFHAQVPLSSCTYLGLDSGSPPVQMSLFFDLLYAMCSNIDRKNFIEGKYGWRYNLRLNLANSSESCLARTLIWEELSKFRITPKVLIGWKYLYWDTLVGSRSHVNNLHELASSPLVHSFVEVGKTPWVNCGLVVNSFIRSSEACTIGMKSIVWDSRLEVKSFSVGVECFICGLLETGQDCNLTINSSLVVMKLFLRDNNHVIVMFGIDEDLYGEVNLEEGTFCNRPWREHLDSWKVRADHLWDRLSCRNLLTARLFAYGLNLLETTDLFQGGGEMTAKFKDLPRHSLKDILSHLDYSKTFDNRRCLYSSVACEVIRSTLAKNRSVALLPYFVSACAEGWSSEAMAVLDEVLSSTSDSAVVKRTLSSIADLLGAMAGPRGGLRTGPGNNPSWSRAFHLLEAGNLSEGVTALRRERGLWLDRPDRKMRSARHYERAVQVLIQRDLAVVGSREKMEIPRCRVGHVLWAKARCPARIDLQGGWSDTPPICYELGGSVLNAAVLVDGQKPVGAKACFINGPCIVLEMQTRHAMQSIIVRECDDLRDYDQPNAQGSLLKAALIASGIISLSCGEPLSRQIGDGGISVSTWSTLPQGCGMGTSSILAGAIVSALWSLFSVSYSGQDVIHAVVRVEQLLTTGGGWQDQVPGILGGVNRCYSAPLLPLLVENEVVNLSDAIRDRLNQHLLLIYTGKVRLAKNLLQNVIRSWYAREEVVHRCFHDLVLLSHQMRDAIVEGNLEKMGLLMDSYWRQKKVLAPGSEPQLVRDMMRLLAPITHGQLLVGAGGGGFMCILTKEPLDRPAVERLLQPFLERNSVSVHSATLDLTGLQVETGA